MKLVLQNNKSLTGYENIDISALMSYSEEVNADNSEKVLNHCIMNLNRFRVEITDASIEMAVNPEFQRCQPV